MSIPEQIKDTNKIINDNIKHLYGLLKELQKLCPHTNFVKEYDANTGNYCKSDDEYWIVWKCMDCEQTFSTDQTLPYTRDDFTMKEVEECMKL